MNMKEKMQKLINEKREQEKNLREAMINGETKEERAEIGKTLAALGEEIKELEAIIAEMDEPAGDGAGDGAGARSAFNPVAVSTMGGEKRGADDKAAEYRNAWLKKLQGAEMTDEEQRALTSAAGSAGAVIPVETQNKIITKIKEIVPLLGEIQLLNVAGSVKFVVENVVADAAKHAEGATISAAADTFKTVQLDGYEIVKLVSISATVKTMSVAAFEDWVTEQLARKVAEKIEEYIVTGTGTDEPKGIVNAATWGDTNSVTFAAATPTAAEIMAMIGKLPSRHAREAKFVMNRNTFWTNVMPVRDDKKMPIVSGEGAGEFNIFGYPVKLTDFAPTGKLFFGNLRMIVGNLADDIEVTSNPYSSFKENNIDYRGTAIFDCDIADEAAFVKGEASA